MQSRTPLRGHSPGRRLYPGKRVATALPGPSQRHQPSCLNSLLGRDLSRYLPIHHLQPQPRAMGPPLPPLHHPHSCFLSKLLLLSTSLVNSTLNAFPLSDPRFLPLLYSFFRNVFFSLPDNGSGM